MSEHTLENDNNELESQETEETISSSSNDNPIDPVTGLSRQEKDYVQQSWHHVRQDLKAAGLGFFHAFFTAHPDYQLKFKAFKNLPFDQLSENRGFQVHAMSVMNAVTMVVDSLDDPSSLVKELKRLGRSHGRNNIEVSHFRDLVVVLLNFLETALGPEHFDEPVKSSWVKALDVVVNVVSTGLPEPSPDAQESTSENSSIDP